MAAKKSNQKKQATETSGPVSSTEVTLGHVFKVRPKVNTSFRPPDFARAKRNLSEESYDSMRDAARAVAEEALSLTRGEATKATSKKRI